MKILAVDYGTVRTGLADCDIFETITTPLEIITEKNAEKLADLIAEKAKYIFAEKIIVGYPLNDNGTVGERAKASEFFANLLRTKVNLPVILHDERYTSISAHDIYSENNSKISKKSSKKRKQKIDAIAAAVLLQDYLNSTR